VEPPAGAFYFPYILPINKPSHQSSYLMMTSHHIILYSLVEGKNELNDEEIHLYEESAKGAE